MAKVTGDHQRAIVGMPLPAPLVVKVSDSLGQATPGVAVAWATLVGGGSVSVDSSVTDSAGQASVVWSVGTVAEINTLSATVAGLPVVAFEATALPGPPARLVLRTQPAGYYVGSPIAPAIQVLVLDAQRNTVTTTADSVTMTLTPGSGAAGAMLLGTPTRVSVDGIATFDDLQIDRTGTGFTLTASCSGCGSVTTRAFSLSADPIARVAFNVGPIAVWTVGATTPPVQAALQNTRGENVTVGAGYLSVALTPGTGTPGAVLRGTLTRPVTGGVATFNDLSVDLAGSGYTLTVTSIARSLTGVSVPFQVQ